MMEQEAPRAELHALRHAATHGDWNRCLEAAEALLRRLPPEQALELVRRQVECRLPGFERHQPGVSWPRELLTTLRVASPSGESERDWPWESSEFPGPGANSFLRALENLYQARHLPADEPRRITALGEALSTAIMAEATEAWGAQHPDRWAFWYENALADAPTLDTERTKVLSDMARAPETVRLKREGWHAVADQLAEALRIQG
jgi:hypothetical protein